MFPGLNGTSWPGGVNDANAVFQSRGVSHIMHQCDGGPPGKPCGGGWEGPNHFVTRDSPCTCIMKNNSRGWVQASHMFSGLVNASSSSGGQCVYEDDTNFLDSGHIAKSLHVPDTSSCCDACHAQEGCTAFTCVADPPPGTQTYYHSWGHVISLDMVRWTRIADALVPGLSNYEHGADCDGSVSFPYGRGKPPVMLFGPGCGYRGPQLHSTLGDAPVVGVAMPVNFSDKLLTNWRKDPENPLAFAPTSPPCSFAGRVWKGPRGEHWSMLCTANGTRARYTMPASTDDVSSGSALHGPWTLVDGNFGEGKSKGVGGNSGPDFMALPAPQPSDPTHILSGGAGGLYFVGIYDTEAETFAVTTRELIDIGALGWTTAGHADDGRVLSVTRLNLAPRIIGWLGGAANNDSPVADERCPKVQGINVCGYQAQSIIRVISWEHDSARLIAYPPVELATLRNATLLRDEELKLSAGVPQALRLPKGFDAIAVDVEVSFALTDSAARFSVTGFADARNASSGVQVIISVGKKLASGARNATMGSRSSGATKVFPILSSEKALHVRLLIDRSIAEFFVAGGRAVYTTRHYPAPGAVVAVGASMRTTASVAVHEMGCGWVY